MSHMLTSDNQKGDTKQHGNSRNFHGEIISGNGKQGCNKNFDEYPTDNQMVRARRRNIAAVVEEEEEESECDHINADLNTKESVPKKDGNQECITEFCDANDEETMNVTRLVLKNSVNDAVCYIFPDGECLKWDDSKYKDKA